MSEPMIIEVDLDANELGRLRELRELRIELVTTQLNDLKSTMVDLTKTKSMENEFSVDHLSLFRLKKLLQEKLNMLMHPDLSDRRVLFEELSMLVDLTEA